MEKVYRLLEWLPFENATDWLRTLTDTPISGGDLWRLVLSSQCHAYIQALGLRGHTFDDNGNEVEVIGRSFQLVTGVETIRKADKKNGIPEKRRLCLEGPHYKPDPQNSECAIWGRHEYWEAVVEDEERYPLYFKPADIEALADKINGAAAHSAEVAALRQELEIERSLRGVIESELRERRAKDGREGLNVIRQQLSHSPAEFAAMRKRAEEAERMVEALDKALTEQAEQAKHSGRVFKEMARRLSEINTVQQPKPEKDTPAGLTFPYATRELEAMRAAVAKYWEGYTPDKRQPTQKAVAITLGELLELPRQSSGDPARKAIALAAAIKPDTLPEA